jgi:hypothetical protein
LVIFAGEFGHIYVVRADPNVVVCWQDGRAPWDNIPDTSQGKLFEEACELDRRVTLVSTSSQHGVEVPLDAREDFGFRFEHFQEVGVGFLNGACDLAEDGCPVGEGRAAVMCSKVTDPDG